MNEIDELNFELGSDAAWRHMLRLCHQHLIGDDKRFASLILERSEAIAVLRDICDEYGDNDWDDSLHLADIIEKHLRRNLDDASQQD